VTPRGPQGSGCPTGPAIPSGSPASLPGQRVHDVGIDRPHQVVPPCAEVVAWPARFGPPSSRSAEADSGRPALVPSGYLLALLLLVLAPPAILGWLAGAVVVRFGWVSRGRSAAAGGGATGALALLVIGPTVAGSLLGAMAAWAGSGHPDRRRARGPRRDPDRAAPVPARPGPGPRRRRRRGPGDCGGRVEAVRILQTNIDATTRSQARGLVAGIARPRPLGAADRKPAPIGGPAGAGGCPGLRRT
jgi:hypothetical protein